MNIYSTGHKHSQAVCRALATGTGCKVRPVGALAPGGVAMYGFLRGLLPMLRQAQAERRAWVYADRGYFGATYNGDYSGYFRVTRNRLQHDGSGEYSPARWQQLDLQIQPWRKDGGHVLVCPPGEVFSESIGGFKAAAWLASVQQQLARSTDREVRIRNKPAAEAYRTLQQDLQGCHALVTYMSNAAVEALLAGVPVFCLGPSAAQSMGKTDLAQIESPAYPDDRPRWAAALAANQWTLAELAAGAANHLFQE